MLENTESRYHFLFALLLGIAGLLVILIFVALRSQSDTASVTSSITNQAPSVSFTTISGSQGGAAITSKTLAEGSLANQIWLTGSWIDNNGCDEVSSTSTGGDIYFRFYRTNVTGGSGCGLDTDDCYTTYYDLGDGATATGGCTVAGCTGGTDVDGTFECSIKEVYYTADATDAASVNAATTWTVYAQARDGAGLTGENSATIEVATLTALDLGAATIAYGAVALGGTATQQTLVVQNFGNEIIDYQTSGTAMTCADGTIAVGQQRYNLTSGQTFASGTALTGTAVTVNATLAKPTSVAASYSVTIVTSPLYWQIQLPSSGLSGACTGTNTLTAISNT